MNDEYIVVLDRERDYCRLFRSDTAVVPQGEVLWSGNGLRAGYDAMIRLNRERRPVKSYSVCRSLSASGRTIYRIVLGVPGEAWTPLSVHYEHAAAKSAMKALVRERNAREEAERAEMERIRERVGIPHRRKLRFTDADWRYIGWLRETGRFAA